MENKIDDVKEVSLTNVLNSMPRHETKLDWTQQNIGNFYWLYE